MLAGAVIASKIVNPWLGIPLAFLSHYCLDMIPHGDYSIEHIKKGQWRKAFSDFFKVFLDISLGISLILLFSENKPIIFAGAFVAIVPDGISLLNRFFPQNKLTILHQKLHMIVNNIGDRELNKKIPSWKAIVCQTAVLITAIFFLR